MLGSISPLPMQAITAKDAMAQKLPPTPAPA